MEQREGQPEANNNIDNDNNNNNNEDDSDPSAVRDEGLQQGRNDDDEYSDLLNNNNNNNNNDIENNRNQNDTSTGRESSSSSSSSSERQQQQQKTSDDHNMNMNRQQQHNQRSSQGNNGSQNNDSSDNNNNNNNEQEENPNHRRHRRGDRQRRSRGAADKLNEIHSALVAVPSSQAAATSKYKKPAAATNTAQNNNEETSTTVQTSDEDNKTTEENSDNNSMNIPMKNNDLCTTQESDGAFAEESDAFAERMLLQQRNSSTQPLQQLKNDCNDNQEEEEIFQIDVVPNNQTQQPNQYDANIRVQIKQQQQQNNNGLLEYDDEKPTDGLLAILLIALHVKGWNVVKVHMDNNKNTMISSISETFEEGMEEEEKEEEGTEQGRRGRGGIVIVVSNNNAPLEEDDLIDLRLLLLSTCADFVCNRRSTLRLLRTFEAIIEPQNSLQPPVRQVESGDTAEESGSGRHPSSTLISAPETPQRGTKHTNATADQVMRARPGAFATPGRAFGAPVRRTSYGNGNDTPPSSRRTGGRSIRRLLSSTGQYISTRFLGNRERRTGPPESLDAIGESRSSNNGDFSIPLAAEVVESTECLEDRVREELIRKSAAATLVTETVENPRSAKLQRNVLALLVIALVIALIVFLCMRPEGVTPPTVPPTMAPVVIIPTMNAILGRGYLLCCSQQDSTNPLRLLEIELCRGLAASILGDDTKFNVTCTDDDKSRWESLASGDSDVIIRSTSHTMSRTIRERTTGKGFSFSSPYFYDGFVFGSDISNSPCVRCADRLDTFFGRCRDLVVCIKSNTTHSEFLAHRMPPGSVRLVESFEDVVKNGICNVIGTDADQISARIDEATNSTNRMYAIGSNVFTKEPLAIVTRSQDYRWTSFVEVFLQGLLEAEVRNITKATASSFPSVPYFGLEFEDMIVRAVASIGNFGEVYESTFVANRLPRTGLNELRIDRCENQDEHQGGLIYGIPLGHHIKDNPRMAENGKLASVLERESLKCGVSTDEAASEFNTKLCMAIASALFGEESMNQFEIFTFDIISEVNGEDQLDVDVFIGASSTSFHYLGDSFQNFTFSKPYLFSPVDGEVFNALVLVTNSGDYKWSAFVHWVINAVINADELSLSKEERDQLLLSNVHVDIEPLVGPGYASVFQDILSSVGSYQEIFNSTMNAPRSHCNLENVPPYGPQHFPFLFQGLPEY